MPIRETLTAKPVTLGELLSNGRRYVVPPFQRNYAWDEAQWQELWDDIVLLADSPTDESSHYLGAIVLQPVDGARLVVDGQQRLVTLSILALAVIARLQRLVDEGVAPEDNRERAKILGERFVRSKSPRSLKYVPRLALNEHDNPFYRTYLVQGNMSPRPGLTGSHRKLSQARRYFAERLAERFDPNTDGDSLAAFLIDVVAEGLRFIQIEVEDDATAFTVFETLNARGVALGTADLLKNYIFQVASRGGSEDLETARMTWRETTDAVPLDELSTLYFHKLADRIPKLSEKRVFAEVKRLVPGEADVFAFLGEMRDAATYYAALDDPGSPIWHDFPGLAPELRRLSWLQVKQTRPLVLAGIEAFQHRPAKLVSLVRRLIVVSLRAWVARVNTGTLQRAYQDAAYAVASGRLKSPKAIVSTGLSSIVVHDERFVAAFSTLAINAKGKRARTLRYLLSELEMASGGAAIDFASSATTLEHILPQNPSNAWPEFPSELRHVHVHLLGNMMPLEHDINRMLGSADYATKREAYARSTFKLAQEVDALEWSPEAVSARQGRMARLANDIWSLDP